MAISTKGADLDALATQIGIQTLPISGQERIALLAVVVLSSMADATTALAAAITQASAAEVVAMGHQVDASNTQSAALTTLAKAITPTP